MSPAAQRQILEAVFRVALSDPPRTLEVAGDIAGLLGFSADDFLSGRIALRERIHADDQDIADVLFAPTPANAEGRSNLRIRQANGRIRCCKALYTKAVQEDGRVLDLRLQDAKSLPRTLSDAATTANFRAMMENTNDFIYFKDRNHVFTGASQTLVALCDPAEHWTDLLGQTDYDVFPEEFADVYYRLEKQVFGSVPVAHEVQGYRSKSGQQGWVDNRKYPILDEHGEIIGLFGIARDITEQISQKQALLESEQRLRLALSAARQAWFDANV
jgi:PAS domain S-box-containing protein